MKLNYKKMIDFIYHTEEKLVPTIWNGIAPTPIVYGTTKVKSYYIFNVCIKTKFINIVK